MRPVALSTFICALTFGCTYNTIGPDFTSPEPIPVDFELAPGTALVRLFNSRGLKIIIEARFNAGPL